MIGETHVASLTVGIGLAPAGLPYPLPAHVEGGLGGDEDYAVFLETEIFLLVAEIIEAVADAIFGGIGTGIVGGCLLFHFIEHLVSFGLLRSGVVLLFVVLGADTET